MPTQAEINQIKTAAQLTNIAQNGGTPPVGWREFSNDVINFVVNSGSGYQAKVFVNDSTKEIFIANAGTNEFKDVKSWPTVITGGNSPQFTDALKVGQQIDQLVKGQGTTDESLRNYTVNTSGYSWGEGMGQLQAYTFGWKGVGFDGVGAGTIVSSTGFQTLVSGMGITPVGKASEFISCNTAGVGPFGGGVVGSLGADIDGTRSCTVELPSSTASGLLNAVLTFAGNSTPQGVALNYVLGKVLIGVAEHDIDNINAAVQLGKFKLDTVGQPSAGPNYQPYTFTDDEGNVLRTKQDSHGQLILGADGKPQYELILNEPEKGQTTSVSLTGAGVLQNSTLNVDTNGDGKIDQTTTTDYTYSPNSADYSTTATVSDGAGKVVRSVHTDYSYNDLDQETRSEYVSDTSGTTKTVYNDAGAVVSTAPVQSGADNISYAVGTAASFLTLVKALQSGKPLPIITSGVNTILAVQSGTGSVNTDLAAVGSVLNAAGSLYNLSVAWKQGDGTGVLAAGASSLYYGGTAYANMLGYSSAGAAAANDAISAEAAGAIGAAGQAMPYLNLVNDMSHGNSTGVALDVVMIAFPEAAPFIAVANILFSMFSSPPTPWGNGKFAFNEDGSIRIDATGDHGGKEPVYGTLQAYQNSLQNIVVQYNQAAPKAQIGLIANRMGSLSYNGGQWTLNTISPDTGAQITLHYGSDGKVQDAAVGSPEYFRNMDYPIVELFAANDINWRNAA